MDTPAVDPQPGVEAQPDDLLNRLDVIESQPLADRAAAYDAIHDDLARQLESPSGAGSR